VLLTAVMTLSLITHPSPKSPVKPKTAAHAPHGGLYKVGPWIIAVRPDPFAGTTTCQLRANGISVQRGALIFRLAAAGDTTATVFRVDSGPPHRIAETFDMAEARGFFPQRGWIVDPNGGEAVLPASYVSGARVVTMRVSRKQQPRRFEVARLAEAEAAAKGLSCPI
jgi:hypothetical protein